MGSNVIFIVTCGTYSDYSIMSVFSERAKAEKYLEELKKISNDKPQIEEWPVDDEDEKIARQYWESTIQLVTGEMRERRSNYSDEPLIMFDWATPNQKAGLCSDLDEMPHRCGGYFSGTAWFRSFESQEHANKLAVEARQAFLRRVDITKAKPYCQRVTVDEFNQSYFYDHPDYQES